MPDEINPLPDRSSAGGGSPSPPKIGFRPSRPDLIGRFLPASSGGIPAKGPGSPRAPLPSARSFLPPERNRYGFRRENEA